MFQKNIRVVYLYLVSLITLIMVISGFIWTMSSFANLVWPENYNYSYKYDYYGELEEPNLEYEKMQEQNQKNQRIKNLINSGTFTVVSLAVFIIHFRKAEKEYMTSRGA